MPKDRKRKIAGELNCCYRRIRAVDAEIQEQHPAWGELQRGLAELRRFTETGDQKYLDYAQLHANGCAITLDAQP